MRTTAIATVLVLGMTIGHAEAQYSRDSENLSAKPRCGRQACPGQESAARPPRQTSRRRSTEMADALGMLRGTDERDAILTMDWRGTGTMTVGGQSCRLAHYRGSVRYNVPALRIDFACAQADGTPGPRTVQVVAGALAWNETAPGVGATPALDTVTDRLVQLWSLPLLGLQGRGCRWRQHEGDARRRHRLRDLPVARAAERHGSRGAEHDRRRASSRWTTEKSTS